MDCLPFYTTSDVRKQGEPPLPGSCAPGATGAAPPTLASPIPSLDLPIRAWGFAQAELEEFDALRKQLPTWAAPDTPAHFFRYSDEQAILAAWAIDDAIRRSEMQPAQLIDWGILAAPEFLGRHQTASYLDRYLRNGAPRASPNSIVQHSLHSVSGTLSILLASRGPNVGIGGGREAFVEGLLAALTLFDLRTAPGCWLVATAWDPPPLPDTKGHCASPARCYAVALAIQGSGAPATGSLTLRDELETRAEDAQSDEPLSVPRLIGALASYDRRPQPRELAWRLPWGATLGLDLRKPAIRLRRAA